MKVNDFLNFLKSAADYNGRRIYFNSAKSIWSGEAHRGYVWGGQGQLYTDELAKSWHERAKAGSKSVPNGRDKNGYYIGDCSKWIGFVIDDCSGLLVDALRSVDPSFSDRNSAAWISQCKERGKMKDMPEEPGLILWRSGHVGVYLGGGLQIEARGTDYGVVVSPVSSQSWTDWGYSNHVDYTKAHEQESLAPLPETDEQAYAEYHAVTTGNVRLRTGPGEAFDKIVTMPKGKKLIALPEKNGWCEACIWLDGFKRGYVSSKYIKAV